MKNTILIFVFGCLTFSLPGQTSEIKHRNLSQQMERPDYLNGNETFKVPNFDKRSSFLTNRKAASPNIQLKNASVLKQRLDSILYFMGDNVFQKMNYTYDNNGNVIKEITSEYTEKLLPVDLWEFSYDKKNQLISQIRSEWSPTLLNWVKKGKEEFVYDNETLIVHSFSSWIESSQKWSITYSYEYAYDSQSKLTQTNFFSGSYMSENGLIEIEPHQTSYTKYFYDINGEHVISEADYDLSGTLYYSILYFYDENDQLTEENSSDYFDQNNPTEYKTRYGYDENNRMIQKIISRKRTGGDFENRYKSEWVYNSDDDLEHYTFYVGDSQSDEWSADIRLTFTYNTDYAEKDLAFPFHITDGYVEDGMAERIFSHQIVNESINGYNAVYYYSPFEVTGVFQDQNQVFSAYPNPASESVAFNWSSSDDTLVVELFQINGPIVFSQLITKGNLVSIKQLESGIYIYQLSDGNKILHTGKLVLN